MTKLSDSQRILLSKATQRQNGSLLPLPATLKPGGGTAKSIAALVQQGLADERETGDTTAVYRAVGDTKHGVFITQTGAAAIGIDLADGNDGEVTIPTAGTASPTTPVVAVPPSTQHTPRASSKSAAIIALLGRSDGATLPELIETTGWLPHTTRAALTGLRKKGYDLTRGKRDGATCYTIVPAA